MTPKGQARVLCGAIYENENWKPGMSVVMDHTALNVDLFSSVEVNNVVLKANSRRTQCGLNKLAVIAARDRTFGLAKMALVYIDHKLRIATGVFRSHEEAAEWMSVGHSQRLANKSSTPRAVE